MVGRLKSLAVEDFRSIRGPVAVSLDAPVVLIHGPNGTGKTSLLSAIELGLTGAVPSLARFDDQYLAYLPHKLAKQGKARITLEADTAIGDVAEFVADGRQINGRALLGADHSRFYTERCYLAQATLGRLLEIYEHQDNRKTDSALTRFVKDVLGLDVLDELIEGLHAAGDVRRFREAAPLYWSSRADAPKLDEQVTAAQRLEASLRSEAEKAEAVLRELAGPLLPELNLVEPSKAAQALAEYMKASETRLSALARIRRDISAASSQVREALRSDAGAQRARAEQASVAAREALASWQMGPGAQFEALILAIRDVFPSVPPASSDPAEAHLIASRAVRAAADRNRELWAADELAARRLSELQLAIRQGQARVEQIDQELANAQGANKDLAEALSALAGHVHGENCPVCGRDFAEVSSTPLAAHIADEVTRLVTAAGRVQALVSDRASTLGAVADARRQETEVRSSRLSPESRDSLKEERATLSEWSNALTACLDIAASGSQIVQHAAQTAQAVSILNSREVSLAGLRRELASYATELSMQPWLDDVPLQAIIDGLTSVIDRRAEEEAARQNACAKGIRLLETLSDLRQRLSEAEHRIGGLLQLRALSISRRREADRRIAIARDLIARAHAVRGDEVRRVFSEELNSVWRDLFIRLAPDEAFVPAFVLPEIPGRPVEALLETLYRSGGKGGNPRAMLSAGNLNTAALTLFLALHLSVPPVLPWLILDDPVQNMDEVHIAQFAALLRTLKQHGKQVIIAVHDRQLFDYLSLELSPAFNGDRLVTVELGRNAIGLTVAPWRLHTFHPDKAIAA